MDIDKAIAQLEALRRSSAQGGKTPVVFGDGSAVKLICSDAKSDSLDKFPEAVVQVRLDLG